MGDINSPTMEFKIQMFSGINPKNNITSAFDDFMLSARGFANMKGGPEHEKVFDLTIDEGALKKVANQWVYWSLVTYTKDAALQVVKEVTIGDGRAAIIALYRAFQSDGPERLTTLIAEFFNLQYENLVHFRQHFNRIVRALHTGNCDLPLPVLRFKILSSLPEDYAPNIQHLYKKSNESTADLFMELTEMDRFIKAKKDFNSINPLQSALASHVNAGSGNKYRPEKSSKYCSHCKRPGHLTETCFILHPELKRPKAMVANVVDHEFAEVVDINVGYALLAQICMTHTSTPSADDDTTIDMPGLINDST